MNRAQQKKPWQATKNMLVFWILERWQRREGIDLEQLAIAYNWSQASAGQKAFGFGVRENQW
jgi:hypothetical protein